MDVPYLRGCSKVSLLAQDKLFDASPFAKLKRNEDKDGASETIEWLINRKLRATHRDRVLVTHFHRLAPDGKDLLATFRAIRAKGATVFEITTGRSSACQADLAHMTSDAKDFYAGRPTAEQLASWGIEGAARSSASRAKEGHMPLHDMDKILDDHSLTLDQAIARINADRRYKTKVSKSWIHRRRGDGKLKFRHRISGYGRR
jgi:hypothetical protein